MAKIVRFPSGWSEVDPPSSDFAAFLRVPYTHHQMSTQVESAQKIEARFRIADWLVEPSLNRVSRDGVTVQLELKAMDVLLCLAGRPGELLTKQELVDAVWQTEFVSDNTLTRRIAEIRDALGDDARNPRYIETIPKRGYRLIADVVAFDDSMSRLELTREEAANDDVSPYPGLAPFTEADTDNFFGRRTEIKACWRKITSHRLLAVVGPSGAGKSSLMRAGVVARAPPGWRGVVCQPGNEPFLALARALAPDLAGDAYELRQLLAFHDPDVALAVAARWRGRWDEALLVVDQFEELFTLNPESVQERFVELLRRLVDGAGIHVVLVLRDDFLLECHRFPPLAPIFHQLTPVGPPPDYELRHALTEPAARHLYGFEGNLLVEEMVGEVESERGALPLLAFAVSRLWELRDRDRRLLTREAYDEIGGVGGALAQHAEATLEAIGHDRLPIVRELFRNLVTAAGTRAVRQWDELLSVFGDSKSELPEEVLSALIDARLLTSYEVEQEGEGTTRRVEIVHESLLRAWPRLVRWQTRDADAAQRRDELRQAAQLWRARGGPDDLLWTGASFREFVLWRESYPGGLSDVEDAFAAAMFGHAKRRRRLRRLVTTAVVMTALAVAVVTTTLWRSSEHNARRAEAGRLYQVGKQWLREFPPIALAYAIASLERADDLDARRMALQALADAPMPMAVDREHFQDLPITATFSQDGRWLAAGTFDGRVALWPHSGEEPRIWEAASLQTAVWASPDSNVLVTGGTGDSSFSFWSVADGSRLATVEKHDGVTPGLIEGRGGNNLIRLVRVISDAAVPGGWTVDSAPALAWRRLGQTEPRLALGPDGARLVVAQGAELYELRVPDGGAEPRFLGRNPAAVDQLAFHPDGRMFATLDVAGSIRLWAPSVSGAEAVCTFQGPADDVCDDFRFDPSGRFLVAVFDGGYGLIWGLGDPPGADPVRLAPASSRMTQVAFHPNGSHLVTASMLRLAVWPFDRFRFPFVLRGHTGVVEDVAFSSGGSVLISSGSDGTVRRWPLHPGAGAEPTVLYDWGHNVEGVVSSSALSGDGRYVVATGGEAEVQVIPVDGGSPKIFGGFDLRVLRAALSADGGKLAVLGTVGGLEVVRIWDLESGTDSVLDLSEAFDSTASTFMLGLDFTEKGDLLIAGDDGFVRWDPDTGEHIKLAEAVGEFETSRDGSIMVSRTRIDGPDDDRATVRNLKTGEVVPLTHHGIGVISVAIDSSGTVVVTGNVDGFIRVGTATGEEPHHLVSNQGVPLALAVSPDGRWIASGGSDGTVRLWPMPNLDGPLFFTLPHGDFLAFLQAQTNLRVVIDDEHPNGEVRAIGNTLAWE